MLDFRYTPYKVINRSHMWLRVWDNNLMGNNLSIDSREAIFRLSMLDIKKLLLHNQSKVPRKTYKVNSLMEYTLQLDTPQCSHHHTEQMAHDNRYMH